MKDQTLKFISYFIIIVTFIYVFVGITGVNIPAYYPVLHKWSISPIKDAVSMGFYSRVAFTLMVSFVTSYLTIFFTKNNEVNEEMLIGFTKATVTIGLLFFIAEEWHKWSIEKMKFDGGGFLNYELRLFIVVSLIALITACITTGNCKKSKK